jgi:hypothetical protein
VAGLILSGHASRVAGVLGSKVAVLSTRASEAVGQRLCRLVRGQLVSKLAFVDGAGARLEVPVVCC